MFNFNLLIGVFFALVAIQTSFGKKRQCLGPNCVQGFKKVPIRNSSSELTLSKVCPDEKSVCEDDETCCALDIGGYGCCDPDHSRCCGDGVHCCPNEIPKVNRLTLRREPVLPKATPFLNDTVNYGDFVCPGATFVCPSDNTCCKMTTGEWACCNLPNAVCCSDGLHCCPNGFTCHMEIGKCVKETRKQRKNIIPILP